MTKHVLLGSVNCDGYVSMSNTWIFAWLVENLHENWMLR